MSFVLTLIWISVSHSSVIDAQSESGSFDVIWIAFLYFFVIIFIVIPSNLGRCNLKAKVLYLENLSPEKFLVCRLHEGGELNLVSSGHIDCHLVQVAVGLEKK